MNAAAEAVASMVKKESEQADARWGTFKNAHEAYAVLLEEVREFEAWVFKRQDRRNPSAMVHELVQVAAVAQRFAAQIIEREASAM